MTSLLSIVIHIFCLSYCIYPSTSDAILSLYVDNQVNVYISPDGWESAYKLIATHNEHSTQKVITIPEIDITPNATLRFECEDAGVIAGFIANINYNGSDYYTANPLDTFMFELISSSDGNMTLKYTANGAPPFGNLAIGSNIPDEAYWVWNTRTANVLIFQFKFAIAFPITMDPTAPPTIDKSTIVPTRSPTSVPTDTPTALEPLHQTFIKWKYTPLVIAGAVLLQCLICVLVIWWYKYGSPSATERRRSKKAAVELARMATHNSSKAEGHKSNGKKSMDKGLAVKDDSESESDDIFTFNYKDPN